jgi:glycosyltransferase involved in cell wall biosynthesis
MPTIVVSPYRTLKFVDGGGHFWVYMQYVHALQQAGCEVYWFERFYSGDAGPDRSHIETLLRRLKRYGLDGKVILCTDAGGESAPGMEYDYIGATRSEAHKVFKRAGLLLNFHYAIDPALLACFGRTALVDIDPGLLQIWMSAGQVPVAPHDLYLTIGETVGTTSALFPDGRLDWIHIRPPVCLDLWPYTYDSRSEAFTTVTDWWTGWVPETVNGREVLYDNTKRASFLAFAELARLTSQPLELAIHLSDCDAGDRQLLEQHGWRVRHSSEVSSTPEMYRSYIQGSRGELSCVKPSYVKMQSAWISDRSLCYLATGKPVVAQDTGLSSYLPLGEGVLRFSTPPEAAAALATVNADYEKHCRAAREIAATYFDARKTAERILNVALA